MLCEMRGFDGSMSGWNGSHGSADSSRGLCVFRKMEIGAYVVNSNRASGHSSYYQGENDSDVVFGHQDSRHQGYPDSWRHELRASKMYVSQHLDKEHQKRRVERSVLRERHQPDYGSTSNPQSTTAEKYSGSYPNTSENYWISTQEMETNQSNDGSVAGNIYQGPIVRVQVPEVYYEGGSTRGNGTAVAYRHNMSYNLDHERVDQDLKQAREMNEIYGSPVSETYRRINEWLKNCQQHSSASFKSSHVSYGSNHSKTENKLKQNTTSGNFSKADYRTHSQTGNSSNLKLKPNEPQFVAALEPKATKAGNVMLQPNHQQKHRNTEKREVPFRHENQSLAPRNNDVTSAFSSNFNHVVNTTKAFYESGLSKTSSEWSSETLSIIGSDKSSYCTDFTPFELGSADSYVGIHQLDSVSTSAHESSPNVAKNVLISHVTIDDRMQRKSVTRTKEFSEALHDSFGNELTCNRRNDKNNFDSGWNNNFGQKSKQQRPQDRLTDKPPKNPTDFKASSQSSKTGRVVTVFIGDAQRTQQGNPQFDNSTKQSIGLQNNVRYQKAAADPASLAEDVQNLKISDRRVFKGNRKSVQVPSETKLYRSDRKPMIPLRCTSLEHPLSSQFTDRDQPFSIPAENSGYKESSSKEDSELHKQLESKPVPQLRSGSLSITIRPNRLTVMDYFKKIDDVWDSSGRREEPELNRTVELSSDIESLQEIGDDTAADARTLDINDGIVGLNSGSRDDVSDESEELDEFTKTVIKADISGKATQSSSKIEFPSKPQYNVLKLSKNLKPEISTLLADVHSRFAGKVYQKLDDKNTDSEDEINRNLKEQAIFEGDIPLSSIPSYCGSRGQPQDCHSCHSTGWHPGKLAESPVRDLQMKFTQNDGPVDDSFGHNSEYMKSKYEDILETDFRSSSERKHSEMYLLTNESVSPGFQSFNRNHSGSHNFTSGVVITPNGSADRMAPVSDELYTDDRSHMETASPSSLPPASEVVCDAFYNHSGLESVQCSKAKATTDKSNEEDRFLMSLLQSHTPDLPAYESFCTPHLQSRNLVRTSDFTMRSNCGGDSGYMQFRSCTDQFDEAASKSVMKSPKTFEGRHLQDEEPSSLEGGKDHNEELYQQKFPETEYSRTLLKDSPDSLLSVLVEGGTMPAAIQRCQSLKSDPMTHKEDSERQDNNGCSKISEDYADASFIINNTVKNSEPLSCQELIDFPENVVIAPPESFSDFTIVL